LATFHVFEKETVGTSRPRLRLAFGACGGGCGCGGCGGCWTGTNYDASVLGSDANPPHHSVKPAHKHKPQRKQSRRDITR
jgi:hypothetical protein